MDQRDGVSRISADSNSWAPRSGYSIVAVATTAACLLLTGFGVRYALDVDQRQASDFAVEAEEARLTVERRVAIYQESLFGLSNLFAAADSVSRAEFHSFVIAGNISDRFPGIQAIEFTRRVAAEDLAAFEAAVRADSSLNEVGFPDFEVHPSPQAAESFIVDYVEPMKGNEAAFGFDLASNPVRLAALDEARDSGLPIATAPIRLVQETDEQAGFLVLVPVYDNKMLRETVEQRRAALIGFVNSVFRVDDMLRGVLGEYPGIVMEIYDFTAAGDSIPGAEDRLFDNHPDHTNFDGIAELPDLDKPGVLTIDVAGRTWLLVMSNNQPPSLAGETTPWIIGTGGLLVSIAMFVAVSKLSLYRRRTQAEAARFRHEATSDFLTGLPNRASFTDLVEHAITRIRPEGGSIAVLLFSFDRFKPMSDTLGPEVGNRLLVAVADRVGTVLGESATLGRFEGGEFVVLAQDLDCIEEALRAAVQIRDAVKELHGIGDDQTFLTMSMGVVFAAEADHGATTLLGRADAAMYQAKKLGPDRIEVFDAPLQRRLDHRVETETELREAIQNHEFRVHYQPIVDPFSGMTHGVEALVRWEHPRRGLLAPGQFIAVAEDSGLIRHLDRIVFETAWQQDLNVRIDVSVNLSPVSLLHPDGLEHIENIIAATELESERICFEITETALIEHPTLATERVRGLRELGVKIALDDFGTGYSSLTHIQQLPLTELKIDRSFTSGLGIERKDTVIVGSTIGMAHEIGLVVVAEGVETPEQMDLLRALGCDLVQGFYLCRPKPSDELTPYLADISRRKSPAEGTSRPPNVEP